MSRPKLLSRFAPCVLALACACAQAQPYRFDDFRLGASFARLARDLDFRDIHAAIARQREQGASRPDLGRRGFGCTPRQDAYAEVACVSHDERVDGGTTREIRLHFLDGVLQQFSITAEIDRFDAILQGLRDRHGDPQELATASGGGYPSSRWRNSESIITAYGGKDLVFVSFELASYAAAVQRRLSGTPALECR